MKSREKREGRSAPAPAARRPIALPWGEPAADSSLRDTGIDLIGRIPWGTHLCLFCETKQDLLDAGSAYFAPTRHEKEHCLWVVSKPVTVEDAIQSMSKVLSDFQERHDAGTFEILKAEDWYFKDGRVDWRRIVRAWHRREREALAKGLVGVRGCVNPLWRDAEAWHSISEYEHALDLTISDHRIILLCTYRTDNSRPEDVLDVARNHQCMIALRSGDWQFLEVPGTDKAVDEIRVLNGDLDVLPGRFARDGILTERERVVMAQLVRGSSSKEAARTLGISPRTVDFHRTNMMRKLGAKNTAELIGKALGTT